MLDFQIRVINEISNMQAIKHNLWLKHRIQFINKVA